MQDVIRIVAGIGALGVLAGMVWPHWRIFKRLGFQPALALLMFVPIVNIVVLYYVAFAKAKAAAAA